MSAEGACPLCGGRLSLRFLDREEVAEELEFRDRFFSDRFERPLTQAELRDVTNVLLGIPDDILRCDHCGILVRNGAPDDDAFRDDPYDERILRELHVTHANAFLAKSDDYRPLLPRGAHVAEIGSYVGGFLFAAREWGWHATGCDVGHDTAQFTRDAGFDTRCSCFEDAGFERESLDAVFIWNCFEQLPACHDTLDAIQRTLRRDGILVLRIPDAAFYVHHRQSSRCAVAYNALLGWPHRIGFDELAIRRLAEQHHFTLQRVLHRPVIRPLRNAMRAWARAEERAVVQGGAVGWMEVTLCASVST
jgi:hypothetical protein